MPKRPLCVTVISWLFIAAGLVGIVYHAGELKGQHPFHSDVIGVLLLRLTAIVSGVFMLRGSNWARWLGIAWIALHVGISAFHPIGELIVHSLLFALFAYFLFRPHTAEFFRT